jgi:hypothetical protein
MINKTTVKYIQSLQHKKNLKGMNAMPLLPKRQRFVQELLHSNIFLNVNMFTVLLSGTEVLDIKQKNILGERHL